jgi:hypothetical protein
MFGAALRYAVTVSMYYKSMWYAYNVRTLLKRVLLYSLTVTSSHAALSSLKPVRFCMRNQLTRHKIKKCRLNVVSN